MQTIEWMLTTTALLACFALLIQQPIQEINGRIDKAMVHITEKYQSLGCSSRNDHALALSVIGPANGCWNYSLSIHPHTSPFTLSLGGDANHYD